MDPQACLQRGWDALAEGDFEETREALRDYRRWVRMGGGIADNHAGWADDLEKALAEAESDAE